jgi:hypothetical protein
VVHMNSTAAMFVMLSESRFLPTFQYRVKMTSLQAAAGVEAGRQGFRWVIGQQRGISGQRRRVGGQRRRMGSRVKNWAGQEAG